MYSYLADVLYHLGCISCVHSHGDSSFLLFFSLDQRKNIKVYAVELTRVVQ